MGSSLKLIAAMATVIALSGCAMGPHYECKLGQACQTEYQAYKVGKDNHNPNAYSVFKDKQKRQEQDGKPAAAKPAASQSSISESLYAPVQYIQPKIAKTWIHAFVDQTGVVTDSHSISWVYEQGHWQGVIKTREVNQSAVLSPMGGGNPANN